MEKNKVKIRNITEYRPYLLAILIFFDQLCKENDIKYSLSDGTLLGAIREKNFIKWDDDVDIIMTRKEFGKLVHSFAKYNGRYHLEYLPNKGLKRGLKRDYLCLHARIVDKKCNSQRYNIDVEFIDFAGDDKKHAEKGVKESIKFQKKARLGPTFHLLPIKSSNSRIRNLKNIFINIFYPINYLIHLIYTPFFNRSYLKHIKDYFCFDETSKYYVVTPYLGRFKVTENDIITNGYINVEFAKMFFPAVSGYDAYLKANYGDYMTPPPISKQQSYHTFLDRKPLIIEIDDELAALLDKIPSNAFDIYE